MVFLVEDGLPFAAELRLSRFAFFMRAMLQQALSTQQSALSNQQLRIQQSTLSNRHLALSTSKQHSARTVSGIPNAGASELETFGSELKSSSPKSVLWRQWHGLILKGETQ
jgi:hypothetical protein